MLAVFVCAWKSVPGILPPPECKLADKSVCELAVRFAYLRLGIRAAITIALFYFLYQLLRAGERMMIPAFWDEKPSFVALMLGIKSPADNADEALKLVEHVAKLGRGGEPPEDK